MAFPKLGTLIYFSGAPFGVVKAIPTYPGLTGPAEVKTTSLAPTANMETSIPNGLMGISPGEVVVYDYPGAFAAIQVLIAAGAIIDCKIVQTDGDTQYYDAAHGGGVWLSDAKLGGVSGAGDTEFPTISFSFHPTGEMEVSATTGHWYDLMDYIAIVDGDFTLTTPGTLTKTLQVIGGLAGSGFAAIIPNTGTNLTFVSDTPADADFLGTAFDGICSWVAAPGSSLITVEVTAKPALNAACTVTTA